MIRRLPMCALALLSLFLVPGRAQESEGPTTAKSDRDKKKETIQPYDKVITKEAKSDPGLFIVHRVDDKLYFEIPRSECGQDLLWVVQIAKTQAGFGYGGTGVRNRVVRWELKDKDILLRDVKYTIRADVDDTVKNAVESTSMAPIIATLPVKAWGKDQSAVIDVTDLFLDDLSEFSAKSQLDSSGADRKRSFVDETKSFQDNIETKITMTYKLNSERPRGDGAPPPPRRPDAPRRDPSQGAVTVQLHHSMVRLPAAPMRPRRLDQRIGFFSVSFEDYGADDQEVKRAQYITRWRLEKKDPDQAVSEPKKPIVFHVGRGVPEKYRAWVKKGIEAWQPAFEAAGFKNAIVGKYAPTEQEDPDWDAEDARYSVINWLPSTIENAMGPHVHDPRTGEILEADIILYHNVIKLARDWYFVQASPNDPRAQMLPLPDDLMGELLAYVVAHEVGHSLGFPHNMKASSAYTVEELRDAAFTKKNGTEASIMDYGRFNYVAQPGDGARLIPIVGPYDFFAVEWGYREFKAAEEKARLAEIARRQEKDVKLRFGDPNASVDPSQQTEDLGSDAIKATELGLKNIARVAAFLLDACCKPGENYDLLRNMYGELVDQRNRELMHVANLVGGVNENRLWFGQADQVYAPVAREKQKEAIAFLNEHAFKTPAELIDPALLARLEAGGAPDRILAAQKRLLASLINEDRAKRMAECAQRDPQNAYPPIEMLRDVRSGIWSELASKDPTVDLYRRNLQRAHVEQLAAFVKKGGESSELSALCRGEATALRNLVSQTIAGMSVYSPADGSETVLHLADLMARLKKLLSEADDAKDEKPAAGAP